MKLRTKQIIYLVLILVVAWIAYLGREVLIPFVLAAIFAYLLDPLVSLLSEKAKFPRSLAIIIVYISILILLVGLGFILGRRLIVETRQFASEAKIMLEQLENGQVGLPDWLTPYTTELANSLRHSITFSSQQVIRFFSGALSSLISFFVFIVVLFYFLKEGRNFLHATEMFFPAESRIEFAIVARKVNQVLGNYLRAQLTLVIFMSLLVALILSILGVQYAIILGLIAGLAELLPIIGPVVAFASIIFGTAIGGGAGILNTSPFYEPIIVGLIYLLLNQIENILIVPSVTGRMVKLHPLLIMISVLVGGQVFGAIGFLVAVPLVASCKVILEHVFDVLEQKTSEE